MNPTLPTLADVEPLVYASGIKVPYSWSAGETASRFFVALRDEQKILGIRCETCTRVFVPPRKICPGCFSENTEWLEVSSEGELTAFSVARRQLAALPGPAPVIFGLVKLDGADTAMLHHIKEVEPDDLRVGMRVTACFADERTGTILDIAGFVPVEAEVSR